ncbi:MAG: hypothetical protein R3E89_02205 [Thiolinea sp.]
MLLLPAFAGSVGLPGTAGFIGEVHTLMGGYQQWSWTIVLLTSGMLITSIYSLQTVRQLYTGPTHNHTHPLSDLTRLETLAAGILVGGTLLLGFYPAPLLDQIVPAAAQLAEHLDTAITTTGSTFQPIQPMGH